MKATELRIGNKVDLYGSIATIERFDFNENAPKGLAVDKGVPIPLTEDWLIKFGFAEAMFDHTIHTGEFIMGSIGILSIAGNSGKFQLQYEMKCTQTTIKFVHQLQNLYFALTNTELCETK